MNRLFQKNRATPRHQSGASIITAIFLLLLFAALAAFMASMVSTANVTSALDVQGVRAYQAARAGVEWGIYQLDPNSSGAALPGCFASPTILPAAAIPGFSVSVACTLFPSAGTNCTAPSPTAEFCYQEAGRQVRIYQITATAMATGSSPVTVEREVMARVEKCRDPAITAQPFDC